MSEETSAARPELSAVYAAALLRPTLVEQVTAERLERSEVADVLKGSVNTLWLSILAPDGGDGSTPPSSLDSAQKSWLLLHAGLLRGFNLALITAWRQSGDSLERLDELYPGFLAFGEALHASSAEATSQPTPGDDQRSLVEQVSAESRRLLSLGLRRGYGLGFLVDAALDAQPGPAALDDLLADFERPVVDAPGLVVIAEAWAHRLDRVGRRRALGDIKSDPTARWMLEGTVSRQSLGRPLAVPSTIGRFSATYVCTMLAYLIHWWLVVGLLIGAGEADRSSGEAAARLVDKRYPVRSWLLDLAYRWAREEVGELQALAEDTVLLRWHLADLSQGMAALGWTLASVLDRARPTPF